jgi:prepilin-type N-terminal cleavage/methylation domain-containing protein
MKTIKNHRGFTLVEVIFAVATGVIVMGAAYVAMISGQRSSVGIEEKIVAQQDVRGSLEIMALEVGMASFNPNFVTGIWREPAGCNNPSINQAYKGIQAAGANTITVEMDIQESSAIGDDANEIITYTYDPLPDQRIRRSTNCGAAQAFLGNTPGNPRSVRVINDTLNIPVFRYFNGLGAEIPAANLPVSIPDIRRIDITLAIETEDVDPNSQQRRRMFYSNSVILRNHAITQ